jgi:YHS domain-containing protein
MNRFAIVLMTLATLMTGAARAADMTAEQKDAAAKLQAKGGLVIPVAANNDALIVSLSTVGKAAGDADLALVKSLPKVEQLDLRNTAITNGGLANLEALTALTHLHLEGTAVTDDGLSHLKGLTNLTYLNLYNTAVTDKGVADLAGLKNLKKLYLWQTKVTDAGVSGLKKSIPSLYVNRGEEMAITTQPAVTPKAEMKPVAKKDKAKPEAATPGTKKTEVVTPEAKKPDDKKPEEKKPEEKKPAQAAAKPINTKCPVSGKDVDPAHVVVYQGKAVGLCCEKCEAKFTADPKAFIDKVVADVK